MKILILRNSPLFLWSTKIINGLCYIPCEAKRKRILQEAESSVYKLVWMFHLCSHEKDIQQFHRAMWIGTTQWLLVLFSLNEYWAENVSTNEFGYELLLTKLDYLEYKFLELQVEIKEQGESLLHSQEKSQWALLERTGDILEQQKIFADHEAFKNSIFELRPKKHPSDNSKLLTCLTKQRIILEPLETTTAEMFSNRSLTSCSEEPSKQSGRYWLSVSNASSFEVYCEQTLYDGGWIVVQNRFNGSVDFYRNWTDYENGFGNLDGEFWLGLENIHLITSTKPCELLVYLEDFQGTKKFAKYGKFSIGSKHGKYVLKTLEDFSGTAGDSLNYHKGQKFTTFDVDNDSSSSNCALTNKGAWWYNSCHYSNLNGLYQNKEGGSTMSWHGFSGKYQGLEVSKIMIR